MFITNGYLQVISFQGILKIHEPPDTSLLPVYGKFIYLLSSNSTITEITDWLPSYHSAGQSWFINFPLYIFFIVLLPIILYPTLPIIKKRRRRKHGLCVKCAYDLTGNESGICPECGTEICNEKQNEK